ncbi:endonuclease domain-containing protein [Streptomyces griseofuscus]|uniref:endonuclease domain-containing protein n=1 Tax=Streptomyces griseofuscus TaxID=146922 RepID=UPI0037F5A5D4
MCSFEGCQNAHRSKGYCHTHASQLSRDRPLTPIQYRRRNLAKNGLKKCADCQANKPTEAFSRNTKAPDGLAIDCKQCRYWLKLAYNFQLSKEDYFSLLEFQGGRCAICRIEGQSKTYEDWHVDHDHSCCPYIGTGRGRSCGRCIRGLLCPPCNTRGLSWYERIPAHMQTINEVNSYLENPPFARMMSTFPILEEMSVDSHRAGRGQGIASGGGSAGTGMEGAPFPPAGP